MPHVKVNGVELAYEEMGDGEPLLMVMGLGAQLVHWPPGLVDLLVARGFRVVRFDNRDVGLSSKLEEAGRPAVRAMVAKALLGMKVNAPYTLVDLADDTVGLLDALGIGRAHVLGVSMGGMIAQAVAIRHPERLHSLTSIMSHDGSRRYLVTPPRVLRLMLQPAPKSREEAMDRAVVWYRTVGSTRFDLDLESIRERAATAFERCSYPPGFLRQMAAIVATPSRSDALRYVRVPSLVIHGSIDPLIPLSGGRAVARAIPAAELKVIDGMGHDLPAGAWPTIVDRVVRLAERSGRRRAAI